MAEKSFPFRSISGDRKYGADSWSDFFKAVYNNGVIPYGEELAVTAGTGMQVIMASGFAIIEGQSYYNTDDLDFDVDPADGTLDRIDSIFLRRSLDNREITGVYVAGTAAATPTAPTLTQDESGDYEFARVDILVGAGVTEILDEDIIDNLLDDTRCGVATVRLDIGLTTFQAQMDALIAHLIDEITAAEGGSLYELVRLQFTDVTADKDGFVTYTASGDEETALYNAGYTYRYALALTGVLSNMTVDMVTAFDAEECGAAIWRNNLPYNGGVYLYADAQPSSDFTLLTVDAKKAVS